LSKEKLFERYSVSLCPVCLTRIPMRIYEENGVIYLEKTCPSHGKFEDIYWGDAELYKQFDEKYNTAQYGGAGFENPRKETNKGCPFDCGPCPKHKTHTILAVIDVTNRCNMACPICFAYAGATNYVYEPTQQQIVEMIKNLRKNSPWPTNALQFSGGEPTLRDDLPDLIKEAKNAGIEHVEVNTNGIRLAEDIEYYKKLRSAGLDTLYLQFDGFREEIYQKLRARSDLVPIKQKVLENARQIGHKSIVLVVTLAKNVNDTDLGEIIDYAVKNHDIVRCVNIQPLSMAGRAKKEEMHKLRITIPDTIKTIEQQTQGKITKNDWKPVNYPVPITKAMETLKNRTYPQFTMHPHCGAATFLYTEDTNYTPVTQLIDTDKFAQTFWNIYYQNIKGKKTKAALEALKLIPLAKNKLIANLIQNIITKGSYPALRELMYNVIMIGIMHFQSAYDFDLDRVQRCAIHYSLPDGTIRSFCTYNTIHRPVVEKQFAISVDEWMKKTGKKVNEYA